jgi:hypothetical protein
MAQRTARTPAQPPAQPHAQTPAQPAAQTLAAQTLAAQTLAAQTLAAGPARRLSRRSLAATTPGALRMLSVVLVLLSLAWGALAGWTVSQHSSAAGAVVNTDQPLALPAGLRRPGRPRT